MDVAGVTRHLQEDHEQLRLVLRVLEAMSAETPDLGDLGQAIDWVSIYGLCHHRKEEEHLFPLLLDRSLPNTVQRLLEDHKDGEVGVVSLTMAMEWLPDGLSEFQASVTRFLTAYRAHIEREDTFLLPVLELQLTQEEDDQMLADFALLEQQTLGEEGRDGYHDLLASLANKVLGS